MGRKRHRHPFPRFKSPKTLGMVIGALGILLIGGGAWAYQEVTRQPPPVPADDRQIPPPETEVLSRYFPSHTAVYGRLTLNGPVTAMVRYSLSGAGLGGMLEGIPVTRYILPGLNALLGYPLYFDGDGELTLENHAALESDQTRRILGEIIAEAQGDGVFGIYSPVVGGEPFHATLAVQLADPSKVEARLARLREEFSGAALFDGVHLEGNHLWITSAPRVEAAWGRDLRHDDAFKRTMAHLPDDRFATVYVNGPELRRVSHAYERYLQGGEEVGEALLGLASGMVGSPATRDLLAQMEQEGFMEQHLGTAATFRLGFLQGHTHTDWKPKDPEGLRQRAEALMRETARSRQSLEQAP